VKLFISTPAYEIVELNTLHQQRLVGYLQISFRHSKGNSCNDVPVMTR